MQSLSIIIPAFNEEKRIISSLKRIESYLQKTGRKAEIIVVDDCSEDHTAAVVATYPSQRVRLLKNPENRGKGFSVRKGVMNAKNQIILFSDADLSTPIEELQKLEQHLSGYDIVIGSRNIAGSRIERKQPWFRSTLGKLFPLLVSLLVFKGIKDTQCGFKLFRAAIAKKIFSKTTIERFGFDVEVLALAQKKGYKIKEVPIRWSNAEGSTVHPLRDSFRMLGEILYIRWRLLRGQY